MTCTDHTPCPPLYLAWHAWAARMARTYRQRCCLQCGRWALWERRAATEDER